MQVVSKAKRAWNHSETIRGMPEQLPHLHYRFWGQSFCKPQREFISTLTFISQSTGRRTFWVISHKSEAFTNHWQSFSLQSNCMFLSTTESMRRFRVSSGATSCCLSKAPLLQKARRCLAKVVPRVLSWSETEDILSSQHNPCAETCCHIPPHPRPIAHPALAPTAWLPSPTSPRSDMRYVFLHQLKTSC